jgi:hypothetical protein
MRWPRCRSQAPWSVGRGVVCLGRRLRKWGAGRDCLTRGGSRRLGPTDRTPPPVRPLCLVALGTAREARPPPERAAATRPDRHRRSGKRHLGPRQPFAVSHARLPRADLATASRRIGFRYIATRPGPSGRRRLSGQAASSKAVLVARTGRAGASAPVGAGSTTVCAMRCFAWRCPRDLSVARERTEFVVMRPWTKGSLS